MNFQSDDRFPSCKIHVVYLLLCNLITIVGGSGRVRGCDFGLSELDGRSDEAATQAGMILEGSPVWIDDRRRVQRCTRFGEMISKAVVP